jgi:hypothetical protein
MAIPERSDHHDLPSPSRDELLWMLADIERQPELTDENENPIERGCKRDQLWELQGWLEEEIDLTTPPSNPS